MTEMQRLRRDRRDADIIAGAAMIIAALDDYQAAYPTATGSKARRHVYSLLEACGITMDDVESRRTATNWATARLACEIGRRQLAEDRADLARLRGRG